MRERTSWGTFLVERVAGRPVSSRRGVLSWELVLRAEVDVDVDVEDVDFVR
jgi:hypothetical protein